MVKMNPRSKSVWAQLGRGTRGRDTEDSGAPTRVSEDAQAKTVDQQTARLFEFAPQERGQIPIRPSTSAGPASSFAKRRNAEKRETKDDLDFNPLAAHGVGTTFYNFPLPASLPTPASSPKSTHHPASRITQVTRPSTPESMEMAPANMNLPQAEIGMALGSPQHPPTAWNQAPMDRYTESPDQADDEVKQSAPVKQKTSKWKLLGGLFGGKQQKVNTFYQVQPETSQQAPVDHGFDFGNGSEKPKSRGRGRSNSNSRKTGKQKPEMSRSETAPLRFDLDSSSRQYQTGTPEITIDGGQVVYDGPRSIQKGAGLLDVDIPSVQMERYSIMFNSVLSNQHSQPSSSSLLIRRQATLDKLKTVNEALASKELELEARAKLLPRRATSPAFKTQSQVFSLFPSTPTARTRDQSPSERSRRSQSLQRSNTSPATLSPSRPSFAPGDSNEDHAQLVSGDSPTVPVRQQPDTYRDRGPRALKKKEEPKAVPEPAAEAKNWSPEESHLLLDESSDNEEPIATIIPMKFRPQPEPNWQMANSAHMVNDSVSGSSTSGSDHSNSTIASSITTPLSASTAAYPVMKSVRKNSLTQTRSQAAIVTQPPPATHIRSATTVAAPISIPRLNITSARPASLASPKSEDEARLESAAGISIARQISVSRQQRQLLVPIRTKSSLKHSTPTSSPTPSIVTMEKKPINPTNPNGSPKKVRVVGGKNFPTPASGIERAAGPIAAIATATQEERERGEPGRGSPQQYPFSAQTSSGKEKTPPAGRLMQVAKPSTPTLVVVGEGVDEGQKAWVGANTTSQRPQSRSQTPSERRRQKESSISQSNSYSHSHSDSNHDVGEIRVGLAVPRSSSQQATTTQGSIRRAREMAMSNRKSERVVVERVGVFSN